MAVDRGVAERCLLGSGGTPHLLRPRRGVVARVASGTGSAAHRVAAIPSTRHPHLVPNFARRLADALDLPFSNVLGKTGTRPEQKAMENSDGQARNVLGTLTVAEDAILPGPVLLVDDVVDSRWTFTVAAWELRRRRCGPVWPLALANAGGRS